MLFFNIEYSEPQLLNTARVQVRSATLDKPWLSERDAVASRLLDHHIKVAKMSYTHLANSERYQISALNKARGFNLEVQLLVSRWLSGRDAVASRLLDHHIRVVKMSYTHLTQNERYQISALNKAGFLPSKIAAQVGRHKSTISRELGLS